MRTYSSYLLGPLAALTVLTLSSCGNSTNQAQLRVLNVSTGYPSLDLYVNDGTTSTDTSELQAVPYETASDYKSLNSATYTVKFKVNGLTDTLATLSGEKLADQTHTTYIAFGSSGNFGDLKISEDVGDPATGNSLVTVFNTAEAGSLDVYLTDPSASLSNASPTFSTVPSGSASSATTIQPGTYRLRVTAAGDKTDLRLDVPSITFADQKVSSLILTSTQGGMLVNAMYLPQQGTLTAYKNTQARVRAAVGIADGTTVTASIGGLAVLNNSTVGIIGSSYGQITAGSEPITLSVDGNPVTIANQTLNAGGDYTLLVWSNANGTQTSLITDDNHVPTISTQVKLRLLNGMSALGAPITLTANFSPVAEGVAVGQASAPGQVDSGTNYELDVSDATNGASLLSKTTVTLNAGYVYTLFLSGGGTAAVTASLHRDR
ncbi:MAG: hypothetical protein JWM63_1018 [Gammaproteobacteria bacterium]|jgi:hypothetical protein|nr:hypothetical protein [Gammaproteobacteria bacterium]